VTRRRNGCRLTFKRIVKSRSTEDFSGVPYVATLLNCLLSAWYGLPFVSPHNLLVSTINGAGTVIEAVYVVLFLVFAINGRTRAKVAGLLALILTVFAGVVLISLLALHGQHRKIFCGFAATIFSICMYASPLSIMRLVIKTKSVEYMPFFLSLFVFLCGTSWFIYGLIGRDPFIAVPNGFGCGLGTLQLILYAIYRDWGGKDKTDQKVVSSSKAKGMDSSAADADAMEMGSIKHEENSTNKKEPSSLLSNGGKAQRT
ncbi:Bidirectional sugar transporter, partial [Nymphaea thermarum]